MKPSIPEGTRDFGSAEIRKRQFIIDRIRRTFEKFGFEPLETPVMENLSTLTGKYGEEGDRLLYKVLNQGDFASKVDDESWNNRDSRKLSTLISDKGLRFDLTVPLARYVVMHRNDIAFPYRRYQIQPVWRGDRPQKGRYREFYQCDADVIGSTSLINETELLQIYDEVFRTLGIGNIELRINNRKILSALANICKAADQMTNITVAIDKLDKIGMDKVMEELSLKGLTDLQCELVRQFISIQGDNEAKLNSLSELMSGDETGMKGIDELRSLLKLCSQVNVFPQIDTTLARGLNYYTGTIVEVVSTEVKIGSIGGGGRYDDLTGIFGMPDVSGVGVSFGLERIFYLMEELQLFPEEITEGLKLLIVHFDEATMNYGFEQLQKFRGSGVPSMIYPGTAKLDKQMKYANNRKTAFVVIIGEEEMNSGQLTLKNMKSGEQWKLSIDEAIIKLKAQAF